LPDRIDEVIRIRPTEEQLEIHAGFLSTVVRIVRRIHGAVRKRREPKGGAELNE
jgi:hypothetical protein